MTTPDPTSDPTSDPQFVLEIMKAGGLFSVVLDGTDADRVYNALEAEDLTWPLHATWRVRVCAESARASVLAHIRKRFPRPQGGVDE